MKKNSKIFVAGGTGLVGSAIIQSLSAKGFSNIISSYRKRKPDANTGLAIRYKNIDLIDTQAVADFFASEKPEFVFLAAAKVGGIVANNRYRADFIYQNLAIQNNIIHQSYINQVEKLLFLGSTCIYPKQASQPMTENCLLNGPLEYTNEPYAIAKIAGIKMCESYNLQYGTNFISVMPTNLYGPNDNFDLEKSHVLPALIRKLFLGKALEELDWDTIANDLNKRPIEGVHGLCAKAEILDMLKKYGVSLTGQAAKPAVQVEIWGTGKPRREFLWSEDMADACVFLMENINFEDTFISASSNALSRQTVPEIRNTHVNIGTGKDISILQLAKTIKQHIGFSGILHFNSDKPDGTLVKLTDASKLHQLGWYHQVELEDGIRRLIRWYQDTLLDHRQSSTDT